MPRVADMSKRMLPSGRRCQWRIEVSWRVPYCHRWPNPPHCPQRQQVRHQMDRMKVEEVEEGQQRLHWWVKVAGRESMRASLGCHEKRRMVSNCCQSLRHTDTLGLPILLVALQRWDCRQRRMRTRWYLRSCNGTSTNPWTGQT